MNNHEQFALELWAKMEGYTVIPKDAPILLGETGYWVKEPSKLGARIQVTIDHPFLHSIIKGLDDEQLEKYYWALQKILGIGIGIVRGSGKYYIKDVVKFQRAKPEQILEAIYNTMNGKKQNV